MGSSSSHSATFSIGKERLSRPFGLASFEVASSFGLEYVAERREHGEMTERWRTRGGGTGLGAAWLKRFVDPW